MLEFFCQINIFMKDEVVFGKINFLYGINFKEFLTTAEFILKIEI